MTTPDIDEEYCSKCRKTLHLLSRDSNVNPNQPFQDIVTELYYCNACSQEYEYKYECTEVIEK